jgi:hypothetical protein
LQEILNETLALERELKGDASIKDHHDRLAVLAKEQRILEGLLATFTQGETLARSGERG